MPLLGGAAVVSLCEVYRVVYLGGHYGGGKTALSFRLAYEILRRGNARYLLSNVGNVWRDRPEDIQPRMYEDAMGQEYKFLDAIVILDEGGLFLRTGKDADPFLAFMRKLNVMLFVPSIKRPASSVQDLSIYRIADFTKIGVPLWWYRAVLETGRAGVRETYNFGWWLPQEIFGIYNTLDKPVDDAGIGDYLVKTAEQEVQGLGQGKHRKGLIPLWSVDGGGGEVAASAQLEAASQIESAVSVLVSEGHRGKRRRH